MVQGMARQIHRLNAVVIKNTKKPGFHNDGGGLYLRVSKAQTKSWVFRFTLNKRKRDMGLGPWPLISLSNARTKAEECRQLLYEGVDPIDERAAKKSKSKREKAAQVTFKECAERYIDSHKAGWKNAKTPAQWASSLESYAFPVFGDMAVQTVDVGLVMEVLEPIWAVKPETASRVRRRIEAVLNWAKGRKYRSGDNPATWKGNLDALLPARATVRKVTHFPAMEYGELPDFMVRLGMMDGISSIGLEFLILTACRTGEAREAIWDEFDLKNRMWTVPAERMKAGKEHRVPLSDAALSALAKLQKNNPSKYILPGRDSARPISNMTFLALLRRMGRSDVTAHGFRSTFKDWVSEETDYRGEVSEMALAHVVSDATEAAYRRGSLFKKRVQLMNDWAEFCMSAKRKAR